MLFPPCLIEHIPLSSKKMIKKEITRRKQMLKENGYKESIISKMFKIITSNYSLSQSQ